MKQSTLSYKLLKIQRNKYISALVVFTFLVTLAFFWLKEKRFELETQYKDELIKLGGGGSLERKYSTFSVEKEETPYSN